MTFNESKVELAAFTWLESLVWQVKYGPEIAPGVLGPEIAPGVLAAGREGCRVVLLRNASTMCGRLRRDRNS